jgi:menaquinone-9 beta-reductase
MNDPVWDVVIVGAGPAGSATALRLARRGYRVLIIDRSRFPRSKPCGECLNPGAVAELGALGVLDRVLRLPHRRLAGWRIAARSGRSFTGDFPGGHPGIAVRRALLDAVLLDAAVEAGAVARLGARVTDLIVEDGEVRGVRIGAGGRERWVRAPLVVGADGIRSVVVRRLDLLRRAPLLRKVALTAHVEGSDAGVRGELHLTETGCIGIAPVDERTANLTVVVGAEYAAQEFAGAADTAFDRLVAEHPGLGGWRRVDEVLVTGPFDLPVRTAVARGVMLVGDAAGYFDPFTGQGVYRALRSAAIADAHAAQALRGGPAGYDRLRAYDRELRRAFAAGERIQRVVEAVTSRRRPMEAAARALARLPRVADRLVGVAGDILPARALLLPAATSRWS